MKSKDRKDMFTKEIKELKKLLLEAKADLFNFKLDLLDYSRMCSYLSFRYRKSEKSRRRTTQNITKRNI